MSQEQPAGASQPSGPTFDDAQLNYALEQIRGEQSLMMGTLAGMLAALAGAVAWALITALTKFQIGWMAIGVGFLVGIAIRKFGNGIDKSFGVVGALLALLGCVLGNLLAVCGIIAIDQEIGIFDVLSMLNLAAVQELMVATFNPMDLVFYAIAVYQAYRLSFRQLTQQDLAARISGQANMS